MEDSPRDTVGGLIIYLRHHGLLSSGIDVYAKALSTSLVRENVDQFVLLVLAKAGYEKRHLRGELRSDFVPFCR